VKFTADIDELTVLGSRASFGGPVTKTSDPFFVGKSVFFDAADSGLPGGRDDTFFWDVGYITSEPPGVIQLRRPARWTPDHEREYRDQGRRVAKPEPTSRRMKRATDRCGRPLGVVGASGSGSGLLFSSDMPPRILPAHVTPLVRLPSSRSPRP
jgi:hypothetical protein